MINSTLGITFLVLITSTVAFGQDIRLSIPASSGAPGAAVTVSVNITDVTGRGIIAVEIAIKYDPQILSAIGADVSGTIAGTWQVVSNTKTAGQILVYMIWSNPQLGPLSGSGTLVNIRFQVQPSAQIGNTSQLHFDRDKTRLNDGTPGVVTQDGIFTVEYVPVEARMEGDANGDNRVDRLDLLKLILMYNKSSGDSGFDPAADFNDDGRIDKRDVVILWKNLGATRS